MILRSSESDLGMSTLHRTSPTLPPRENGVFIVASSSASRAQWSWHVMVANGAMGPDILRQNGIFSFTFGDFTSAITFPSIDT